LELQTKGIEDEKALNLAKEGQGRVRSMALIHQKLYQNDDLLINFNEYIQSLVKDINSAYSTTNIEIIYEIDNNFTLDIDTAIPLGLIINELITNSFKYAFSKEKINTLSIQFIKNEDRNLIIIKDNGPGIKYRIKVRTVKSIGLRLVRNLVKQLHGSIKYKYDNGAEFSIYFKETCQRNLVD
jgi:two-component sensor histidine kinase